MTDANGVQETAAAVGVGSGVGVALCAPQTDGDRRLSVGFQVVNTGSTRIKVVAVEPRLPRSGLLRLRSVRLGGSCGDPGDEKLARYLPTSGRLLVTMELRILDSCPKPAPVGVRVTLGRDSGVTKPSFPLFADLSSVVFAGC